MNPDDPNVHLVEGLVQHLGDLSNEFVFVGGCATGLLVTDTARPPVRATTDVDLVAQVTTRADYYELTDKLRALGYTEDASSDVVCRWIVGQFSVDIMPVDDTILGFSNRWYPETVATAVRCILPSGATINLISSVLFLATKLEAFHDRGNQDYGVSHDMEDIITIIDGRLELIDELADSPIHVAEYLQDEFDALLSEPNFVESIRWHLPGDAANQARLPIIIERLRFIARI